MEKAKAVGRAAMIRLLIVGLEKRLEDSAVAAEGVNAGIADALNAALGHVHAAHAELNEAESLAADHYGDPEFGVLSGGTGESKDNGEPGGG